MKTSNLFKTLWMAMAIAMTFASCSNDDDNTTTADETIGVDIRLEAKPDLARFADAYVVSYVNGDVTTDTLDLSKAYTKHIAGTHSADTVGYVVYLSAKPGIEAGSYQGQYDLDCTTTLTEGGREVSRNTSAEGTSEFRTVVGGEDSADHDSVAVHLFTVKDHAVAAVSTVPAIPADDDMDTIIPSPPAVDKDTPFSAAFYYSSPIPTVTDSTLLSDNLAMRFAGRKQWNGETLTYGDILFVKGSDVATFDKGRLKSAADAGVVLVMEGGKGQLEALCEATGIPCFVTPDGDDVLFILSKAHERSGVVIVDPIFLALSPHANDGRYISDYMQGVAVDAALRHVKAYLTGDKDAGVKSKATRAAGDPAQALNQLVSAYRVSLLLAQNVRGDEYRNPNKMGPASVNTNLYEVNYSIWNVFDIEKKLNFYYVHQELIASFNTCYAGIYNKSVSGIAKVCEWYGKNVKTSIRPADNLTTDMHIEYSSPTTTSSSTTYTSGVSYGLSGTVGYNAVQGPQISASANLTFSSSESYSIPDIQVYNRTQPGVCFEWEYDLADVTSSFSLTSTAMTNLRPGAAAGRSSLVAGADYIFSFPERVSKPVMLATLIVNLRSSCSKCGFTCKVRDKKDLNYVTINLPALSSKDFEKK